MSMGIDVSMVLAAVLFVVAPQPTVAPQSAPEDRALRRLEAQLIARLRWETLWSDTPEGFKAPGTGVATLAIARTPDSLSYCSQGLGVCERYQLRERRIRHRLNSVPTEAASDQNALADFVGLPLQRSPGTKPSARTAQRDRSVQAPVQFGRDFLPLLMWNMTAQIGTRLEIVDHYKKLRHPGTQGLVAWVQESFGSRYESVDFACFEPTDPIVFLYGERRSSPPIIVTAFWDDEREEWVEAGLTERASDPKHFDRMRETIRSISCGVVKF